MAIENPSVLYLEQSLSPEQKTVVCENIGAVRTVTGKGLSTEDFTTAEKNKLNEVESGAEANVIEEIKVNGTAVTPVNKSVDITIPNDVFQATYGVTTYNEILAAVNDGRWITCLNGDRLATFAYVGANCFEFNYHRSRSGNVDEMFVYKVDTNDTWTSAARTLVPKFDGNVDGLVPANGASATKYLKGDGSWDTPTDTTYSVFSTSADGLVPASDGTGETGKFLKGDGTWDTPTDTTYSVFDTTDNGLVPAASTSGDTGKYLKGDGTWDTPTDTTYSVFDTSSDGLVPAADGTGETGKFLKGDGTWDTPTDTTYSDYAGSTHGLVPARPSGSSATTKYLREDGSWEVPPGGGGSSYSAGDGIDITNGTISANIDTDAGLTFDSSNPKKIQVNTGTNIGFNSSTGAIDVPTVSASTGGTGGTDGVMLATDKEKLDNATVAVQLEGALAPLTPSSGVATIPNAIPTGTTGATNGLITADDQAKLDQTTVYQENPYDLSGKLLAQQFYVVESDQQIIDIAGGGVPGRKGTIFFRVG